MNWTPTAENINALEPGLRDYIHRLEANTDPAGMVRENVVLGERVAQLNALVDAVARMHAADNEYGCGFYDYDPWVDAYAETRRLVVGE